MDVKIAPAAWLLTTALLLVPCAARADAGPPYLTNDPGTPGDGHWEINLASMQTIERGQEQLRTHAERGVIRSLARRPAPRSLM